MERRFVDDSVILGEAAVEAMRTLEGLARHAAALDGDELIAVLYNVERQTKAVKAAAGNALKAIQRKVSDRAVNGKQLPLPGDNPQEELHAPDYLASIESFLNLNQELKDQRGDEPQGQA